MLNEKNKKVNNYNKKFTQHIPKYGIKNKNSRAYTTVYSYLTNDLILSHIDGNNTIATLGRWYSEVFYIDIDNNNIDLKLLITSLRKLGISEKQFFIIQSSKSKNYHIIIKVLGNNKVNTLNYSSYTLNKIVETLKINLKTQAIELYPHSKKLFRLPYSEDYRKVLDTKTLKFNYVEYEEFMYIYENLKYIELNDLKVNDGATPLLINLNNTYVESGFIGKEISGNIGYLRKGWYSEGKQLLHTGLVEKSSRHISQAKIIYYLFCCNLTPTECYNTIKIWLKDKNNGYSKDYKRNRRLVYKEALTQIEFIYNKYNKSNIQAVQGGAFDVENIKNLIKICNGSLQLLRFGFKLFGYLNARSFSDNINVHSDLLQDWSSWGHTTYLKNIEYFIEKGLLERSNSYSNSNTRNIIGLNASGFSKSIKIKKDYKDLLVPNNELILNIDETGFSSFDELITNSFNQKEYRNLLKENSYLKYDTLQKQSKLIFKKTE